jgi:hypothetical protein
VITHIYLFDCINYLALTTRNPSDTKAQWPSSSPAATNDLWINKGVNSLLMREKSWGNINELHISLNSMKGVFYYKP